MEQEAIDLFINQFDQRVIYMSIKILAAIIIALIFKTIAENIVGYIILRLDQYVGISTCVEIFGVRGKIREISFFTITIETACGFIRVPTRNWRTSKFIILKEKLTFRREQDLDCGPTISGKGGKK